MIGKENDKGMNRLEIIINKIARIILYRLDFEKTNEWYLKLVYKRNIGKALNLNNPQTFNEKIQWKKLYDKKNEYTSLVDKIKVKKVVGDLIGEEHIIPNLGIYANEREIDFESLPDKFVLKCNHDSGSVIICRDKSKLDKELTRKELKKSLKHNLYYDGREWAYKNVKPCILAETLLLEGGEPPKDYKVYCFNGKPKLIVVFYNRFSDGKKMEGVYDTSWNKKDISLDAHWEIADCYEEKPECLEELLSLSETLCKNMAQVRVDFFIVDGKIYFGEITLYTAGGLIGMIPEETDAELGKWIDLGYGK